MKKRTVDFVSSVKSLSEFIDELIDCLQTRLQLRTLEEITNYQKTLQCMQRDHTQQFRYVCPIPESHF